MGLESIQVGGVRPVDRRSVLLTALRSEWLWGRSEQV